MSDVGEYTAELGVEIIRGIQEQNVAATIKHFPGVGTYYVNAHDAPSKNTMDMDTWRNTYGRVYKAAFEAGVMSLMTTHMSLDSYSTSVDYPGFGYPIATYNKDINLKLIKGELGFQGVIVTDAMTMGGCGTENGIEDSVAAFACGADLILWPEEEVGDRIVEEIEKGNIPMSRLDDAIERIQRLRERLGMDRGERVKQEVDPEFVDTTMKTILQEGITVLRNELGNLPLDSNRKKVLVVPVVIKEKPEERERALRCGEIFGDILKEAGFDVHVTERAKAWDQLNARKIHEPFDYLIHLYDIPFPLNMGGSWSTQLMPMAKKVGISFSAPYLFEDYFAREKTYVQMNCGLNEHSARAAAYSVLGKTEMVGKMAIKIKM
jgi:beta-N-acetylhexosaminidase